MIIDNEYSYNLSFLTCKPSDPEEDEYTENKNAQPDCFFDAHGLVLYNLYHTLEESIAKIC